MSFLTSLKNPPKDAVYWLPTFYYRDPETGAYTPYYPEDYLNIGGLWLCPLSAGMGIMVDYRCVVYDGNYNIIGSKDQFNIVVKDGEEFVYNWGAGLGGWLMAALALGVAAIAMVVRPKRAKP